MTRQELFMQLRRVRLEGLPGACVGCQIQKDCARRGCYALRKVSSVVGEKGEKASCLDESTRKKRSFTKPE